MAITLLISLLVLIGFGVFIILLLRNWLTLVTVFGDSMYPTLQEGDRLLVLRSRSPHSFKVGQLIVAHPPYEGKWREKLYIKHLAGLPGDKVTISVAELNPQIHFAVAQHEDKDGNRTWHVPDDYCFVQGDSYWSEDCRAWGLIPLNSLVGIVRLKLPRHSSQSAPVVPGENVLLSTEQTLSLTQKEAK